MRDVADVDFAGWRVADLLRLRWILRDLRIGH